MDQNGRRLLFSILSVANITNRLLVLTEICDEGPMPYIHATPATSDAGKSNKNNRNIWTTIMGMSCVARSVK